jgi:acetolactate synthase-1/3 small subunit
MEKKPYTIVVFTENHIGLLNHVTIVFTRRKINIESLTVSESEIKGIHSFTIVVNTTHEMVEKIAGQLEKLVEVMKAFYYTDDQLISQEIALYKLPSSAIEKGVDLGRFLRNNDARILDIQKEYIVIEKTGMYAETQDLLEKLRPFGILEFVRSGRIVITKPMKSLETYIKELQDSHDYMPLA